MRRLLLLASLCAGAHGSDILHVPLLVKYHQESHALAGALAGLAMDYSFGDDFHMRPLPRLILAGCTGLALGCAKEYLIDHHARNKEIGPCVLGALASVSLRFTF